MRTRKSSNSLHPRLYQSSKDFEAMKSILVEGRNQQTGGYFVHVGDLSWWLYYVGSQENVWSNVYIWEDSMGCISGWTLLSPQHRTFDVFLKGNLRGFGTAFKAIRWSASHIEAIVRKEGGTDIRTMWVSKEDVLMKWILKYLGFKRAGGVFLVMERAVELLKPEYEPVYGFRLLNVGGEADLGRRAAVSYAAFESELPFDLYCQRYLDFMRSPVYNANLDVVAEDSNGLFAAFCICWLDRVNRIGHFEPVGVHPEYRGKGLGKAILLEGMRRMRSQGMVKAMVCAKSENTAAVKLYESVGFECVDRLYTFTRGV